MTGGERGLTVQAMKKPAPKAATNCVASPREGSKLRERGEEGKRKERGSEKKRRGERR